MKLNNNPREFALGFTGSIIWIGMLIASFIPSSIEYFKINLLFTLFWFGGFILLFLASISNLLDFTLEDKGETKQ